MVLDLTNDNAVRKAISQIRPGAIVNAAAVTDVDRCELERDFAFATNATAAENLAKGAQDVNAFMIQVSTDYVFDGEKGMYSEEDNASPVNHYGQSKLEGEKAVMRTLDEGMWSIARASVVYGWGRSYRPNAATYVYDKLSKGEEVQMVCDQFSSPTLNTNLSAMILEIAERQMTGILHTAGATRMNRYDFALGLAKTFRLNTALIRPVESVTLGWRARRPKDSSLNVLKAQLLLHEIPMPIDRAYDEMRREHISCSS